LPSKVLHGTDGAVEAHHICQTAATLQAWEASLLSIAYQSSYEEQLDLDRFHPFGLK
jgi:hypothetical protein